MSRIIDKNIKSIMLLAALAAGAAFFASVTRISTKDPAPGDHPVYSDQPEPDQVGADQFPSPTGSSVSDGSSQVSSNEGASDQDTGSGAASSDVDGKESTVIDPEDLIWTDKKDTDAFGAHISLAARSVTITSDDGVILWRSDEDWQVQDYIISDVDRDGEQEILLLVWKHGSFGEHRPFFVEENDNDTGQHIFIFSKRDGDPDEVFLRSEWMSSAMRTIVSEWKYSDEDGLELTSALDGSVKHYAWQGWGLKEMMPEVKSVRFVAFGDVIAHEQIWRYAGKSDNEEYDFLFDNVRKRVQDADMAAIVQETPFAEEGAQYSAYPDFASPAGLVDAEYDAGFDVIACATNHMMDCGSDGIGRVLDAYGKYEDVTVTGISEADAQISDRIQIRECNGIRIAFADYTYGLNGKQIPDDAKYTVGTLAYEERVREELKYADWNADVTVVFVHWGEEYEKNISDEQYKWTEIFYECGADAVIGSHPHVLQPYELYDGVMPVYYSLGNYVSGQDKTECVLGGMASFTIEYDRFNGARIADVELEPVITHQEANGIYTTYFLRDYDPDHAADHRLDVDIPSMWRIYDDHILID